MTLTALIGSKEKKPAKIYKTPTHLQGNDYPQVFPSQTQADALRDLITIHWPLAQWDSSSNQIMNIKKPTKERCFIFPGDPPPFLAHSFPCVIAIFLHVGRFLFDSQSWGGMQHEGGGTHRS